MLAKKNILSVFLVMMLMATIVVATAKPVNAAESRLNVVVLGDSYSSGTGATTYYGEAGCYRSNNNYGYKYTNYVKQEGVITDYTNLACHGAVTGDVAGQVSNLTTRERNATDIVFLTIGGNDGSFDQVARYCLVLNDGDACFEHTQNAFDIAPKIKSNMKSAVELVANKFSNARIVFVGYPYLVSDRDSCEYNKETSSGFVYSGSERVRSLGDLLEAVQIQLTKSLNEVYGNRISFVSVKQLFNNHEICSSGTWWLRDTFETLIVGEWWHPNKEGYTAEAEYLYGLGLHKKEVDVFKYSYLPFVCGYEVPYASTYDSINLNGVVFYHDKAIDMPVASGTKLVSPADGVAYSKTDPYGYGYYVELKADNGKRHIFAHMQENGRPVSGSHVAQGQVLGYTGSSGAATGPHLHYEQWKNGVQVNPYMGGPSLEWTKNLTSNGFRTTYHSLESANCGGNISGLDKSDELLFYNADNGKTRIYDMYTDAKMGELDILTINTGWSHIVALEYDGDSRQELMLYRPDGTLKLYNATKSTIGNQDSVHQVGKWTHVVVIDLEGDGRDEILLYNSQSGDFIYYDVQAKSLKKIKSGTWSAGWEQLFSLEIDGTKGDELFFRKRGSDISVTRLYNVGPGGGISLISKPSLYNSWSIIIPVELDGDNKSELLFYRQKDGKFTFFDVSTSGNLIKTKVGSWNPNWQDIVAIEIDGDSRDELIFYNDTVGSRASAPIYNASSTGLGSKLKHHDWSNGWEIILPVRLN